jgi:hypothetical protein
VPLDWARGLLIEMAADRAWSKEPDLARWLEAARLNVSRDLRRRGDEPLVRAALARFRATAGPGVENLGRLLADAGAPR